MMIFKAARAAFPAIITLLIPFFLSLSELQADIIHLKNGKSFEGVFQEVKGPYIVFRTEKGPVRIRSDRLQRIEILFSGVGACLRTRKQPDFPECGNLLNSLSSEKAVMASEDGRKQNTYKTSEILSLKFEKKNRNQRIIPVLRKGLELKLRTRRRGEYSGKIVALRKNQVSLRLKNGRLRRLRERDLVGGFYQPADLKKEIPAVPDSGISLCLRLRSSPAKVNCQGALLSFTEKSVVVGYPEKGERKEMNSGDVRTLEFRKKQRGSALIPLLPSDVELNLQTRRGGVYTGKIERRRGGSITLRLKTGRRRLLRERDLLGGTYTFPSPEQKKEVAVRPPISRTPVDAGRPSVIWKLIPGAPQIQRDDWIRGIGIPAGFVALAGAGAAEYRAAASASQAAKKDLSYLFYNNSVYLKLYLYQNYPSLFESQPYLFIITDSDLPAEFERHQKNQRIIGGLALLLYAYHIYDSGIFSFSASESSPVPSRPDYSFRYLNRRGMTGERLHELSVSFQF